MSPWMRLWARDLTTIATSEAVAGTGTYAGGAAITSKSPEACPDAAFASDQPFRFEFTVAAGVQPDRVLVSWGSSIDTVCRLDGRYSQQGQFGAIAGDFSCADGGFTPAASELQLETGEIAASADGFGAGLTLRTQGCTYTGHIGGVRVAD